MAKYVPADATVALMEELRTLPGVLKVEWGPRMGIKTTVITDYDDDDWDYDEETKQVFRTIHARLEKHGWYDPADGGGRHKGTEAWKFYKKR
jgi:hypothetical protein